MSDLIERLESASEGSRELDEAVCRPFLGSVWDALEVTTSLDDALALAERVLPSWIWDVTSTGTAWVMPAGDSDEHFAASAKTPPLALCIAILKARGAAI